MSPRRWTAEEDSTIADVSLSDAEVGALVGRSAEAVRKRRIERRIRRHRIGPTRRGWLIAKTCPRCGRLLAAESFHWNVRSYASSCRDCAPGPIRDREIDRQTVSTRAAGRRGQPWTGADLEVALRADLSEADVARMLGRTVYGVQQARRRAKRDPVWIESFKPR